MSVLRITEPDYTNRYYKHVSSGGVNECIRVNGNSVLPNCVGYAWGAWYEMTGVRPKLSRRNAKEWYGYTSKTISLLHSPTMAVTDGKR